ncbi:MAG: hypothetical protein BWY52_03346 [Chloroflexi bacterium ADurb.Bin325]|nr:MAG: hypothetical protein BWY52_03346 [Chloroflexi bacterium ADurb.Bin325]
MTPLGWTIVILTVGLIGLLTALALTAMTMLP